MSIKRLQEILKNQDKKNQALPNLDEFNESKQTINAYVSKIGATVLDTDPHTHDHSPQLFTSNFQDEDEITQDIISTTEAEPQSSPYDSTTGSMLKYTVAKANLQCEGTNTSVLIDSCASASLVSAEFLKNLRVINKRHIKAKPIQQKLQINGVGGHHDQPTHYVWLRIKIGQKQIWHPFIIYDSFQHELLMGLDFIATYAESSTPARTHARGRS